MVTNLERTYFHESLHNLYEDGRFEEFGSVTLMSFERSVNGASLVLRFSDNEDILNQDYEIILTDIGTYNIQPSFDPYIEICDRDPKLIIYNSTQSSLYFKSMSRNPAKLIEDVASTIKQTYAGKISLQEIFLNVDDFIKRSRMEFGLYMISGKEIVELVHSILINHNMEPSTVVSKSSKEKNYKILYFGKSWILFKELKMKNLN